jgi:hypothetical protein
VTRSPRWIRGAIPWSAVAVSVAACGSASGGPSLAAYGEPCLHTGCADSASGVPLECDRGICTQACSTDHDCPSAMCIPRDGCVVPATCDPITNAGCPDGERCSLWVLGPGEWATECNGLPSTTYPDGGGARIPAQLHVSDVYQGEFGSGGSSEGEILCRLDHPSCAQAPAGTKCLPLDGPTLGPIHGVTYGTCRMPCDPGQVTPTKDPCSSYDVNDACMWETNAGRAPVATCLPISYLPCSDNMGGSLNDCIANLPVSAACASAYSSCAPSCATDADCPPTGTCKGGTCAPTPIACDPFRVSTSCAAGQTCVVQPDGKGGGTVACARSGGGTWPATCSVAQDCAAGGECVHYGDPAHGVCEPWCNLAGNVLGTPMPDYPQCSGATTCVSVTPATTIDLPTLGVGGTALVLGTCAVPCDPVDPSKACPSSLTCVPFVDADGKPQTDCIAPTGMGTGPNACTSSPLACAPGYTCRASDNACVKWCYVGVASSCPAGQSCVASSPPVTVSAVAYGTCQ